jgi:catechol 2,3-dioxygenase-like lactoylglutathione lyase family enzyme
MFLRVWDVTFTVSDLARTVDFYEGVLDLPKWSNVHSSGKA